MYLISNSVPKLLKKRDRYKSFLLLLNFKGIHFIFTPQNFENGPIYVVNSRFERIL